MLNHEHINVIINFSIIDLNQVCSEIVKLYFHLGIISRRVKTVDMQIEYNKNYN